MQSKKNAINLTMKPSFILMSHCKCLTVTPDDSVEVGTAVKGDKGKLIFHNSLPMKWNHKSYEIIKWSDIIAVVHQHKNAR